MKKLIFLLVLLLCLMVTSCKNKKFDKNDTDNLYVQIVLSTDEVINLKLFYAEAPISVENFINIASSGYYNNVVFHRIVEGFMIQTGEYILDDNVIKEKSNSFKAIKGEFKSNGVENNIHHELGVISMARTSVKDSATSQFFICAADCSDLDGNYAAFGKTTDSKSNDVVLKVSRYETVYVNSMFTHFPIKPISIKKVNLSNKQFGE